MIRRLVGTVIVVATAAVLLVVSAPPAHACSCASFTDPEALAAADVVFAGALVETQRPPGPELSSADPMRLVFDVDVVYKGTARSQQSVVTASGGSSCGLELQGAGPFLVFALTEPTLGLTGEEGEVFSHLCTGSRALSAAAVPAKFGDGDPPDPGASPIGAAGGRSVGAPVLATGALLVLAAAGGAVWMRRRPAPSA